MPSHSHANEMTPNTLKFDHPAVHRNLATPLLIEAALRRGEGVLAANGALNCETAPHTGRSPKDKFLEDTESIHEDIWWGNVNKPIKPEHFDTLLRRAVKYLNEKSDLFEFKGFAGADPTFRIGVRVVAEKAWHALFSETLFIRPNAKELAEFKADWLVLDACDLKIDDWQQFNLNSSTAILQSIERKIVIIFGSGYAGEIKKSIFYAMNYDMPAKGVFPMHCSANVSKEDRDNVAVFFGLSGTGKTTLSADPKRMLIGDDEHGWSDMGVFNFEGGCYAKCINLSKEKEPQIYNAIRFGSVLENVVLDEERRPDYTKNTITENTRVTYPVDFIDNAKIPSVGRHPKNIIFLTADAYGVLPPVSRLNREQAMYYFVNGYTSKLAGTERGITEPQPNFSPCFGGPFLPRHPQVYADMLAHKVEDHKANVWLLNTGWTGGPYGVGHRMDIDHTRAMVTAILNGSLAKGAFKKDPIFGVEIPTAVDGVPSEVLDPRNGWKAHHPGGVAAYEDQAHKLAAKFRENDAKFDLKPEVRAAGPQVIEAAVK